MAQLARRRLRLATRASELAQAQARLVARAIVEIVPCFIDIVPIVSRGDRLLDQPLASLGADKGWFVKELEVALLENQADIAVHSLKDMTVHLPEALMLGAVLKRANPADCFISSHYRRLTDVPAGGVIGTSSLRRAYQIKKYRPNLSIKPLRGNITSRLQRLNATDGDSPYAGIVLACAGLQRLHLDKRTDWVCDELASTDFVPSAGQGAIAVECRKQDKAVARLLRSINHEPTEHCVVAERNVVKALGANCSMPLGVHAWLANGRLRLIAEVGLPDGNRYIRSTSEGDRGEPVALAREVSDDLLARGAAALINR